GGTNKHSEPLSFRRGVGVRSRGQLRRRRQDTAEAARGPGGRKKGWAEALRRGNASTRGEILQGAGAAGKGAQNGILEGPSSSRSSGAEAGSRESSKNRRTCSGSVWA